MLQSTCRLNLNRNKIFLLYSVILKPNNYNITHFYINLYSLPNLHKK